MSKSKLLAVGALALALAHLMCAPVPLTAPSGSTLTLNANPMFVHANGGVSALVAVVTEPAGTFVPDGTVVFFLTDLGSVDAQAKTKDGFARATFVSDSRSGAAHVTAFSGGPSTTPSVTPTATPTPTAAGTVTAAAASAPFLADNSISANVTITVGSALPEKVIVTANPPRITEPRNTQITANVFDAQGNPVFNVPVIFTVTLATGSTGLLQEALDSGGQPRFTDSNGQAFDTLRTSQNRADPQKAVTVTANLPGPATTGNSVTVFIN